MKMTREGLGITLVIASLSLPTAYADSIWGEFDSLDTDAVALDGEAKDTFAGRIRFGYLASTGNTENTSLNGKVDLGWEGSDWRHALLASSIYSENDVETTAESYRAGYKADRKLGERNYLFGSVSWEQDEFSGYEERTTQAVGYGRRVIETAEHTLDLEIGIGARQSELIDGTEQDETIGRLFGNYLWKFGENSDFSQQISVESGDVNTYVESITALTSQLLGELDLVVSYTAKRNSAVPDGRENLDTYTTISVQYNF